MKGFRWKVMGFIFFAYMLNFMDRSALSYVIAPLQQEFGLNNAQFGLLYAAFGLSYLIMTLVGGILVDRFGPRRILSLFSALWSLVSAMMALTTGFFSILCLRVLLGVAEGPAFPALTRVSADWLPQQERGRALAMSLAAIPLASVIGAPLISNLVIFFGWQWMFVILGGGGLIWSLLWYRLFRDQPRESKYVSAAELELIESSVKKIPSKMTISTFLPFLRQQPQLILAYLAYFCLGYLLSFSVSWWPGYLHQTYGLGLKQIGWLLCIPWLTATCTILCGGAWSDYLWQKTRDLHASRFHVIMVAQLCSALSFVPLLYSCSLNVAILSISLGLGFGLMPIAPFYAINSDLALEYAGTSQGFMSSCLGLASFVAPALSGYCVEHFGQFQQAILVMMLLLFSASLGCGLSKFRGCQRSIA